MISISSITPADALRAEVARFRARRGMLAFTEYCWRGGLYQPFKAGPHTRGMCCAVDKAITNYKRGVSTYLMVRVPFRHGKSEIISRFFPAFALGHLFHMDPSMMLVGSDEDLTIGFSRDAQSVMNQDSYRNVFPNVTIHKKYNSAGEWGCQGRHGRLRCFGVRSRKVGRGASLMIFDDWCGSREEAESVELRNKVWDTFRNDMLTRLAPVHIVIVVGTPWHVDGLQCRILAEMKKSPDFPQFQVHSFPARKKIDGGKWEYLFTDLYPESWYRMQYANLTPYEAAGLLDCDPVAASGNMASRAWFLRVPCPPTGTVVKKVRYWDCAATAKRTSDFTASGCMWKYNDGRQCIAGITLARINYAQIGDEILAQAKVDGPDTQIWIEFEKGSMGLIGPSELARPLIAAGFTVMLAKRPTGPKHTIWQGMLNAAWQMKGRGEGMPIVDGPNVDTFLSNVDAAPSPTHDDDLDAVSGAHNAVNGLLECEAAMGGGMQMEVE